MTPDWELSARYDANKRAVSVAFFLWFCLGLVGGHRFYFRRFPTAAMMAALAIGGGTLMWNSHEWRNAVIVVIRYPVELPVPVFVYTDEKLFGAGWLLFLAGCAWWAMDAFLINTLVRRHNSRLIDKLKRAGAAPDAHEFQQAQENPNAQV